MAVLRHKTDRHAGVSVAGGIMMELSPCVELQHVVVLQSMHGSNLHSSCMDIVYGQAQTTI